MKKPMKKPTRQEMTTALVMEIEDWDLDTLISVVATIRLEECKALPLAKLRAWYADVTGKVSQ